jgi:hypothetical protein
LKEKADDTVLIMMLIRVIDLVGNCGKIQVLPIEYFHRSLCVSHDVVVENKGYLSQFILRRGVECWGCCASAVPSKNLVKHDFRCRRRN